MTTEELKQRAEKFLKKRTKQKDNLVISREEALSGLVDFASIEVKQITNDNTHLKVVMEMMRDELIELDAFNDKSPLYIMVNANLED